MSLIPRFISKNAKMQQANRLVNSTNHIDNSGEIHFHLCSFKNCSL